MNKITEARVADDPVITTQPGGMSTWTRSKAALGSALFSAANMQDRLAEW